MPSWLQGDQLSANLADALFTLTDVSVKATLILLLALMLSFLLRKKAARVRHLLWSTALFGVLVLPALSFIVPAWHWRALPAASAPPIVLPLPGEIRDSGSAPGQRAEYGGLAAARQTHDGQFHISIFPSRAWVEGSCPALVARVLARL